MSSSVFLSASSENPLGTGKISTSRDEKSHATSLSLKIGMVALKKRHLDKYAEA